MLDLVASMFNFAKQCCRRPLHFVWYVSHHGAETVQWADNAMRLHRAVGHGSSNVVKKSDMVTVKCRCVLARPPASVFD